MRAILVTGGGRGIGRAIAGAFASPETSVIIAGRDAASLDRSAAELRALGGQAIAVQMDVSDEASVASAFATIRGQVDRLDVVVNNAGVGGGEPIAESDTARWRRTLDVNVFGMYLVSRQAAPMMRDGGSIVNLSSVLGRFGVPGYTAYCASKHAVIGFTRALALELAPSRVTVNAICPGWVDTEMALDGMRDGAAATGVSFETFRERALGAVPINRFVSPEEVARLVVFLAAPDSSAITGQTYNICGGQTMD